MKVWDNGGIFTVEYNESEVIVWARTWPGFGVVSGKVWFQFDRKTGGLVDLSPNTDSLDPSGVLALSQDACRGGLAKLEQLRGNPQG